MNFNICGVYFLFATCHVLLVKTYIKEKSHDKKQSSKNKYRLDDVASCVLRFM